MLYVSWASDLELCSPKHSEIKPVCQKGLYYFVCDSDPIAISSCGEVEINVFFTPKSHCKSMVLTLVKGVYGQSVRDETGHFRVKLDFTLKEHFSIREGKRILLSMTLIELEIYNQDDFIRNFFESESHKIVAQIKIKQRSDMMNVRTIFIGRPQEIITSSYAMYRRYIWKSGKMEDEGFTGIGLRIKEDLTDIRRVQQYHTISPRDSLHVNEREYVQDNDGFSNCNITLPIEFEDGEAMNIQMFNLKFDPPKFIELQLRSAEFNGDKRCYKVIYDASIDFEFEYEVKKKKIVINSIKMRVKSYVTTLNNLGEGKAAKTV